MSGQRVRRGTRSTKGGAARAMKVRERRASGGGRKAVQDCEISGKTSNGNHCGMLNHTQAAAGDQGRIGHSRRVDEQTITMFPQPTKWLVLGASLEPSVHETK